VGADIRQLCNSPDVSHFSRRRRIRVPGNLTRPQHLLPRCFTPSLGKVLQERLDGNRRCRRTRLQCRHLKLIHATFRKDPDKASGRDRDAGPWDRPHQLDDDCGRVAAELDSADRTGDGETLPRTLSSLRAPGGQLRGRDCDQESILTFCALLPAIPGSGAFSLRQVSPANAASDPVRPNAASKMGRSRVRFHTRPPSTCSFPGEGLNSFEFSISRGGHESSQCRPNTCRASIWPPP